MEETRSNAQDKESWARRCETRQHTVQWEESGIEREVRVAAGWEGFRTEDVYQEELGADMNIW